MDVACGTHEHVKFLRGYDIDGLDINDEFLDIAREKNPRGRYFNGDMVNFSLATKYDVILCLFSSIGYVLTEENLRKTIQCFKGHLKPGGLILVEPWFTPDKWFLGKPHMLTVDREGLKICRLNVSEMKGRNSFIKFHYLLGQEGLVEHFTEEHELGLFTKEQMLKSFQGCRLEVEFDSEGLFGRGLYIGRYNS